MLPRPVKLTLLAILGTAACLPVAHAAGKKTRGRYGTVYAMTNGAAANEVIAFRRAANGTLTRLAAYATGGQGTGPSEVSTATPQDGIDPLASQGSLTLSHDGRLLFAVNAGSNSVSSFRVASDGTLTLADMEPSGGTQPNSVNAAGSILYVSNVGSPADGFDSNVTGFQVGQEGNLTQIAGSTAKLSTPTAQPARVIFRPGGGLLAVSELTTNRISTFQVTADGTLTGPTVNNSAGAGPFGSIFASSRLLLVAEAGAGALSSYSVSTGGALSPISPSVANGQMATCWVVLGGDGRLAFTSNTGSDDLSSYRLNRGGALTLLQRVASTVEGPGSGPIDSGVSADGRYLYVLDGGKGAITVLRVDGGGRLRRVQGVFGQGLPPLGSQGLAVRG